jgi:hypothetical protein
VARKAGGLEGEGQKSGLGRILGFIPQDGPTCGQDHAAMPGDKLPERLGIAPLSKGFEQRAVAGWLPVCRPWLVHSPHYLLPEEESCTGAANCVAPTGVTDRWWPTRRGPFGRTWPPVRWLFSLSDLA